MQDMHIKEIPWVVRTFYLECVTGGSQAMNHMRDPTRLSWGMALATVGW